MTETTPPPADIEAIREALVNLVHRCSMLCLSQRTPEYLTSYVCVKLTMMEELRKASGQAQELLSRPAARGGDENLQADSAHHAQDNGLATSGGTGVGLPSLPPVGIAQAGLTREQVMREALAELAEAQEGDDLLGWVRETARAALKLSEGSA